MASPDCDAIQVCKTVYVPSPFVNLLLGHLLTATKAWKRLRGEIVDGNIEDDCKPVIDLLREALVWKEEEGTHNSSPESGGSNGNPHRQSPSTPLA